MKAIFLVFSPSGHTLLAAQQFMSSLEGKGIMCRMINITKNDNYIHECTLKQTLAKDLDEHQLLVPCAPVYAGHCEGNILRVIRSLPLQTDNQIPAIPLVTYGGVHSSVAPEEMGRSLRSRNYTPIMGVKIAAEHTLTTTCRNRINPHMPSNMEKRILTEATAMAKSVVNGNTPALYAGKALAYAPLPKRLRLQENCFRMALPSSKIRNPASIVKQSLIYR